MTIKVPLGELNVRLTADAAQFQSVIDGAIQRIDQAGQRLTAVGRGMTAAVTVPLALLGGAAVREFARFDDALTTSLSIMGDVTGEMRQEMSDLALTISSSTIISAEQLAESYFFLASAGLTAEQSMASLNTVTQFAVAGAFDMARATDLLTDAQSALGLSSDNTAQNLENMTRLSDGLIRANTLANATAEQFSTALVTRSGAALQALNKDLEEGLAVLAAFADQGIKAELAGNSLAIVLRDLQNASLRNTEVWDELGLSVFDASGEMRNTADIIEQLENLFGSMSDEQKRSTATMLGFQDRSFAAIQALLGTSEGIRAYEAALRSAGGATEEVSERQVASFSNQMIILQNNVRNAAILIGQDLAPLILRLGDGVQRLINRWNSLSAETRRFIVLTGVAVAAIGPLFLVLGFVAQGLVALLTTTVLTSIAMVTLAASILLLTDSILALTGNASLGLAEMIGNFRVGTIQISTWFTAAWLLIFEGWVELKNSILTGWLTIKIAAQTAAGIIFRVMLRVFQSVVAFAIQALGFLSDGLADLVNRFVGLGIDRAIDQSLTSAEARWAEYFANIDAMDQELRETQENTSRAIANVFAEDEVRRIEAEQIARPDEEEREPTQFESMVPDAEELAATVSQAGGEFQTIALNRFSLEGLAQTAPTRPAPVVAEAVEDRLDRLIEITEQAGEAVIAVLG